MKRSVRNSNIELMRLVAMMFVLALHANFLAVPVSAQTQGFVDVSRIFVQSFSICAVNLFVMISGWFGIHASLKGFLRLMWTVGFFVGLLLLVQGFVGYEPASGSDFRMILSLNKGGGWFVQAYMILYILSPVLNAFVKDASVRKISCVLAAFFSFQLVWGVWGDLGFILQGYSPVSLMGLYLLAGLLRRIRLRRSWSMWLGIYAACSAADAVLYILLAKAMPDNPFRNWVFVYINPLVIIQAASLLLCVVSMRVRHSRVGNWLGRSAFAIYLVHVGTPVAMHAYLCRIQLVYNTYDGFRCLARVVCVMLCVAAVAIVLDQVRQFLWWCMVRVSEGFRGKKYSGSLSR